MNELDELRARGRAASRRKIDAGHRRMKARQAGGTLVERGSRLLWGDHPWPLRRAFHYFSLQFGYCVLVTAAYIAAFRFFGPIIVIAAVAVVPALVLLFAPVYRIAVEILVWAEGGWLDRLPFPVEGYLESLSRVPSDRRRRVSVSVELCEQETLPGAGVISDLLGLVDATATPIDPPGRGFTVRSPAIPVAFSTRSRKYHHHSDLRRWQRRLLARVLIPLSRQHPVARVYVD